MVRVYCAGPYSSDTVMGVFGNMRRGLDLSVKVLEAGYAVFSPWTDYNFLLKQGFSLQTMYNYSMAWLEVSEAVLVVDEGWQDSQGTHAEIARAKELGIPVFFCIEELMREIPA